MKRIVAIVSALVLGGVVYLIGWSSVLTVSSVTVKTSDPKNVSLIIKELNSSGLGISAGDRLARINSRAIERTLKEEAWIGQVDFRRDWINGEVHLVVKEKVPRFMVREIGVISPEIGERFMTENGVIFQLPGDLANEYQNLPKIELRGSDPQDRAAAVDLFDAVDPLFPTKLIVVTPLSTFITESTVVGGKSSQRSRVVRISWGSYEDIETKLLVLTELLALKANRFAGRIDVTNPQLPIVSNR